MKTQTYMLPPVSLPLTLPQSLTLQQPHPSQHYKALRASWLIQVEHCIVFCNFSILNPAIFKHYLLCNFLASNACLISNYCHMIYDFSSQTICTLRGTVCVSNLKVDIEDCLAPCEGIFADVSKIKAPDITGKHYDQLLKSYDRYKRFFDLSESNNIFHFFSKFTH